MTAVLALDQGTTSTRALRLEADGRARLVHAAEHRQIHPRPGWVEHDPEELLANLRAGLAAGGRLDAIGLANQGESCLAWTADDKRPLTPVIVWQDSRTEDRVARLRAEGAETETLARAGLPLDPYFSASKLGWIVEHVPEAKAALAAGRLRLGTTDAFFLDRLTGRFVTDATTASRTSLMDLERGAWDPELCRLFGVPLEALPEIVPTTGHFGAIDGVPVTASVVDQQAALHGHGAREPGDVKMTFGTGAFALMVAGDRPIRAPEQGLLPTVAWRKGAAPPVYALDGGVWAASAAVNWARGLGLFRDFHEIDAFEAEPALARGLAFVPALVGLGAPHWDRGARGAWLGLDIGHGPRDLAQAVLEGVALRGAEVLRAMRALGPRKGPLSIDGGMSANAYFTRFLAEVLEEPVLVSAQAEATALGAAELAAEGAGLEIAVARERREVAPERARGDLLARFGQATALARRWRAD